MGLWMGQKFVCQPSHTPRFRKHGRRRGGKKVRAGGWGEVVGSSVFMALAHTNSEQLWEPPLQDLHKFKLVKYSNKDRPGATTNPSLKSYW